MSTDLSEEQWFLSISENELPVSDADAEFVLRSSGCDQIEVLGAGTAQCRIPIDWLAALERKGGHTHQLRFGTRRFAVDIDLP